MRKHDLTIKKTKTKTKTKTMKITNTFREHLQRAISETFDKFHNTGIPGIVGIPGVRAVSQFLQCFSINLNRG